MSFIENPRFPDQVAYGATFGPVYSTDVVAVDSGDEDRNSRWNDPLWGGNVSLDSRNQDEIHDLLSFFYAIAKGRKNAFRVKDFSDFVVTTTVGRVLQVNGSTTIHQLIKRYTSGSYVGDRKITKPIADTITMYDLGVEIDPDDYTLDATTGFITFDSAVTAVNISWSGQFDCPVRFDTDKLDINIDGFQSFSWNGIVLVGVRR